MVSPRKDKCLDKNMLAAGVSTETTPFVYSINKASPHILGARLMRSGAGESKDQHTAIWEQSGGERQPTKQQSQCNTEVLGREPGWAWWEHGAGSS